MYNLKESQKYCDEKSLSLSGSDAAFDNRVDELFNQVLDHLKEEDYQVLRKFKGKSKLSTYLSTIVSNIVVDLIRKNRGRSRVKQRAAEMGGVAEHLYDAIYVRGFSIGEAQDFLRSTWGLDIDRTELDLLLKKMQGRENPHRFKVCDDNWPPAGFEVETDNGVEVVVPDPAWSAEEKLVDKQRELLARQVLDRALTELTGEERFIITLRFPFSEDKHPMAIREIAEVLGVTEKALDNRVRRILMRCREIFLRQGLSLKDLIDVGK